jgi:hypothetical protein
MLLSASYDVPVDELYNELMSKEQRVLDTIKTVAEKQKRQTHDPDNIFGKSISSLWVDVVLSTVRVVSAMFEGKKINVDHITEMHIGIAITVIALVGIVLNSI